MARINEYTTEVFLDRVNGDAQAIGQAGFNKAQQSLQDAQMYEQRGASAARFGQVVQQQRDVQGQLRARERFNQFQRDKITWQQQKQNERMTNPDGFAKEFDDWHRINGGEIEDEIGGLEDNQPFDLQYFRTLMDGDRTSTLNENTNWENGMRVRNITTGIERNVDDMVVNFALTRPTLKDLPKALENTRQYVNTTGAKVLDPTQNEQLAKYGVDKMASAVLDAELENNPKKLRNVIMYGNATQDQLIEFVFDVEGRDKIAEEPDGAIAKFGINSKHNGLTHDQVKNLTADDARAILKNKYWDARLDKMEPSFRAVAFDALVNHGNDKDTWAMIQAAKGDPYTLIAIRKDYYTALSIGNPGKYAKYKAGWDRRMQEMTDYAQAQDDGGRAFLQNASLVNPEMIIRTQALIPNAMAEKARQEEAAKNKLVSQYNTAEKDIIDILSSSPEDVTPQEMDVAQQLAVNTGDAEVIARFEGVRELQNYAKTLKTMTPEMLDRERRGVSAAMNKGEMPNGRMMIDFIDKVKKNVVDGIAQEGIAFYGRTGQIKMPEPINYSDPRQAANELRSREDSTLNVYQKTGKLMPVLAPDEITTLKTQIAEMPANQAAGIMEYYASGLEIETKGILAEAIDKEAPNLATAIMVDDIETRRRIFQGDRILKLEKPEFDDDLLKTAIVDEIDPMTNNPRFTASAIEAVRSYYIARAAETGTSLADGVNSDIMDEAITKIYGPRVDLSFIGTNQVFNFKDETGFYVPDDDIYNMFNDMNDDDLKTLFGGMPTGAMGETITAQDIRDNAKILSAGDAEYNVNFPGIGDVYDSKGGLLTIDGRKLLKLYRKKIKAKKSDVSGTGDF